MGVKEVLYRTRDLGWGVDTRLYETHGDFRARFAASLAAGPRVLKQNRGNGGQGVWKVELASGAAVGDDAPVEVLHAQRGSEVETMPLGALMDRCEVYFAGAGCLIDQPFQPRLPEGMIRCYLVRDRVVGFGRQLIKALMPPPGKDDPPEAALPGPRIMSGADYPPFDAPGGWSRVGSGVLRRPPPRQLQAICAELLYGPKTAAGGAPSCEINVGAVLRSGRGRRPNRPLRRPPPGRAMIFLMPNPPSNDGALTMTEADFGRAWCWPGPSPWPFPPLPSPPRKGRRRRRRARRLRPRRCRCRLTRPASPACRKSC